MVTAYLLKDYRDIWLGLPLRKTRVRKREESPSGYRVCEGINTMYFCFDTTQFVYSYDYNAVSIVNNSHLSVVNF